MSFTKPQAKRLTEKLSPREREILRLMAEGLATKQIAGEILGPLGQPLAEGTVRSYRIRIFSKLGVKSIGPAIRVASIAGLF